MRTALTKRENGVVIKALFLNEPGIITSWRLVYYPPYTHLASHRHDIAQFSVLLSGQARETTSQGAFDSRPMLLEKPDLDERVARRVEEITSAKAKIAERLKQYLSKMHADAPTAKPTFGPADLAGDYVSPRLGTISILSGGEGVRMTFPTPSSGRRCLSRRFRSVGPAACTVRLSRG